MLYWYMLACCYVCKYIVPATSHQLDHLILIGCDDPGQTAGQQHADQLVGTENTWISQLCIIMSAESYRLESHARVVENLF